MNQTWNNVARTFIRNSRKCTARNPNGHCRSTCQLVKDVAALYHRIKREGREVPFNGLTIESHLGRQGCCPHDSGCSRLIYASLPTDFVLKYLEIRSDVWTGTEYDQFQGSSLHLIRQHASQIKYLRIQCLLLLQDVLTDDDPSFANLEEVFVFGVIQPMKSRMQQKRILRRLIAKSPNIKKVYVNDPLSLETIPEEYYCLAGSLVFWVDNLFEYEGTQSKLLPVFVGENPNITELVIEENFDRNGALPPAVKSLFTTLLQSCAESLRKLTIVDWCSQTISPADVTLKNLSKFNLEATELAKLDQLWDALTSIDGCKMMPKLVEIDLEARSKYKYNEDFKDWPLTIHGRQSLRCSYSSVRKLRLDLSKVNVNLLEFKTIMPHVVSMELRFRSSGRVPCAELWELWPNLEELKIFGLMSKLTENYDAEFCGISEEEAEELRTMDDEYLGNVHIVPIRPSLLTMQSEY